MNKGQIYKCDLCDKRFKSPEFVHKHIFNKHKDKLDEKFNSARFEDMFKDNYMNDPNKPLDMPMSQSGSYGHGGYRDRGGYRGRRYDNHREYDRERDDRKRREYVDYDDPSRYQQNPER